MIDEVKKSDKKQKSVQLQELFVNLKLEDCGIKNCSNKLHHICRNNIDNVQYKKILKLNLDWHSVV